MGNWDSTPGMTVGESVVAKKDLDNAGGLHGHWSVTCMDPASNVKWVETISNLVVLQGQDYILSTGLVNSAAISVWYIGLMSGTSSVPASGDTAATHAGWTEVSAYGAATRQAWTPGAVGLGTVDNSGAVASFTFNAAETTDGAFLISVNTKSGTTGTLYAAGSFASARGLASGDTLLVSATFTMSAA